MSQIVSTKLHERRSSGGMDVVVCSSTSTLSLGHRLLQKIDTQEIQDAKKTPYFKATSKQHQVPYYSPLKTHLLLILYLFHDSFLLQLSNHNL